MRTDNHPRYLILLRIFLLILLFFKYYTFLAQIDIGVRGGLNLSSYIGSDIEGSNSIFAYHAGIYSMLYTVEACYWQPEALFSVKGSRYDDDFVDVVQKLYYIDIPVTYHYTNENGNGILLGPQFSTLLKATNEIRYGDANANIPIIKIYELDAFRKIDVGIIAGFVINLEDVFNIEGRVGL
ncbi:MAG: PorT family protein [Bacteroidia bacterium]|nr:PorT family protein [Bacteroidia bacterium]